MTHTYIIAEAGVNHNGSFSLAKQLIDVAKEAGADAVKFQTFKAENLVTKDAEQANYQVDNIGKMSSQYQMLKELELSFEEFVELKKYCDAQHVEFLSTPFDVESVDFLVDRLNLEKIKIPSGELTNIPFLHYIATKKRKMIVSTGMASMEEIHEALAFIAFGLAFPEEKNIQYQNVMDYYRREETKTLLRKYVVVLHCTTEYPAPFDSINLNAMHTISKETNLDIGFSDHSKGIIIPVAAVAQGATIIEKHFTIDRNLLGPDHKASLEPDELKDMVAAIRQVELALGSGEKEPMKVEIKNQAVARKSLVALKPIQQGEQFTKENLGVKRPGIGISPEKYWSYLHKTARKFYSQDELIDE
ncbi:N-acetylneuraminate synthase [Rummeliibacillus suwonensis]|uniref:N-acetylneuraminate synthase n=1 Tax=Rummeliibacillus suwonensis TaxID=1306154 RepID=UPI001AAFE560|nr:N-acetylneuraminate synthase [Rummeliibacillus suwonensis]MBO2534269.1 N-acetylneuraminate synthase [Rummeliibacillus suwonensis]